MFLVIPATNVFERFSSVIFSRGAAVDGENAQGDRGTADHLSYSRRTVSCCITFYCFEINLFERLWLRGLFHGSTPTVRHSHLYLSETAGTATPPDKHPPPPERWIGVGVGYYAVRTGTGTRARTLNPESIYPMNRLFSEITMLIRGGGTDHSSDEGDLDKQMSPSVIFF